MVIAMILLNEAIRSGCSRYPSEDVFGFRETNSGFNCWVIDGATSIAVNPMQYRNDMSDPAWFARALSLSIFNAVGFRAMNEKTISSILLNLRNRYLEKCACNVHPHDYPLAAATYVNLQCKADEVILTVLEYADCFFSISSLDGDFHKSRFSKPPNPVFSFPVEPKAELPVFSDDLLSKLRVRRLDQNINGASSALTLRPESALTAKKKKYRIRKPTLLLIGSDGFERLWRSYRVRSEDAVQLSARMGRLLAEMSTLREWELESNNISNELKSSDDATVLSIFIDPTHTSLGLSSDLSFRRISKGSTLYLSRSS